ncbi:TetR/AcrR family transcriptional regulator [Kribbella antibiotica]|uniref:TetR/AcrR family transcriptional regulator n=1 Tax=Kribbella antibiotica TaxID=190195 RepID=A0A4R4Z2Z6_9ACTN|nr:TetR/AcrR family transcriptional regulator [Kribbella antibiotica]TDD51259.1 TetR/AcrR family transcriptional regulator [Kribbella antibiotica]
MDSLLPPQLVADGAKGRLLAAAVELFAARGYHGVSVRDLTAHLGVQPSSLYAKYASKAELFSELVFLANEQIRDRMRAGLLEAGPDPAAQLAALTHANVEFHTTYPLFATIAHNDFGMLTESALHHVAASRKEAIDLMRAVIDRGNDRGVFDCPDPWTAIAAIAGFGIRLAVWYRPQGRLDDPSAGFAAEVQNWMGRQRSIEDLKATYATYTLRLVGWCGHTD